jgi:uncharacterized membrane protein
MVHDEHKNREFPTFAGILLGLGLGGFFDGIILHQVLQWHHMHQCRVSGRQRAEP